MRISMTAILAHTHVNEAGETVQHEAGSVYDITDYGGMTAEQLATSLTALNFARRTDQMTGKKPKAAPAPAPPPPPEPPPAARLPHGTAKPKP